MSTRVIQEKRPTIERIEHTNFGSGRPYYDDELKMSQSEEHTIAISYLFYCLKFISKQLNMGCLSDNPVWYLLPKLKRGKIQKALYPDLCVSKNADTNRATAEDLLFCLEVVNTERRRKEVKDSIIMKGRNEYNRVPEFVLIFPKASDNRVIEYYQHNGFCYIPLLPENGEYKSRVIRGFSIREIPRDDWKDGEKVEVLYKGEVLVKYDNLWSIKEEERKRANIEHKRAEKERLEKEKEQRKNKLLVDKLREMGVNLDELTMNSEE
ncbi:MAG: hypothetical protein H7A23_17865 [Leptospiraceae bacterium]|nr:hypothetical protein [Leptospiraceae bacterium]